MRFARVSFRWFTASLKSLWITGSHASSAMLVLPCLSSCLQEPQDLRSELFLTIPTVHADHLPHSGPPLRSFFLYLLVHHLMLPFVYGPEQKSEHCSHPYFWPDRKKGDNFFEFTNLLFFFSLFHISVFFFCFFMPFYCEKALSMCARRRW